MKRLIQIYEAFGPDAEAVKQQLEGSKDTYAAISMAIKLAGDGKDPVELASALHDALYGEGSKPQPLAAGSQSSGGSVFQSSAGLKLQ